MIDIVNEIEAIHRELGEGRIAAGPGRAIRLRRDYDAPIEDVWDAVTNPERLSRWFLPVSGDYRLGGSYQFEGNAGGTILECERPNRLKVTWVFGEVKSDADISEVELRLATVDGGQTRFELDHTAIVPEEFWAQYGPGAVGVGWDGAMLGLALHLRGETPSDPAAWQVSPQGREYSTRSSEAWGVAYRATGADPEAVARAVANSTAFYAPEPGAAS
jgi:uncharacterized protein YndB with AHSA1/START domain